MSPAGFAAANNNGEFKGCNPFDDGGVIEGVEINVNRPPPTQPLLIDRDNANGGFAVQMASESFRCAFLTHKGVFTFAFSASFRSFDIDGAIGFVETAKQNSEPRNEASVHIKKEGGRSRPPSSFLKRNVVVVVT